jgi:hypothetical protein
MVTVPEPDNEKFSRSARFARRLTWPNETHRKDTLRLILFLIVFLAAGSLLVFALTKFTGSLTVLLLISGLMITTTVLWVILMLARYIKIKEFSGTSEISSTGSWRVLRDNDVTDITLPMTFHPKKGWMILWAAIILVIGIGPLILGNMDQLTSYLKILVFCLVAAFFVAWAMPSGNYLRLDRDGFTVATLFRKEFIPWSSVGRFSTFSFRLFGILGRHTGVKFFLRELPPGQIRLPIITGVDYRRCLPNKYGQDPEELADLLNAAKHRFGTRR